MPTTRAPGEAARAAARRLIELPTDALGLVLYQLTLAHDIAAVAPTCHALDDAAKIALKLRPFSGEVVTVNGRHGYHDGELNCVAVSSDGCIITGADSGKFKLCESSEYREYGEYERGHTGHIMAVAVLPGQARFVSGAFDGLAKLGTMDGFIAHERTFAVDHEVHAVGKRRDAVQIGAYLERALESAVERPQLGGSVG